MTITFACPQCGVTLRVPDSSAGHKGKCKNCNAKIRVPGEAEFIPIPPEEPVQKVDLPHNGMKVGASATFGPVIGPVITGLLFCLVLGVAVIGFFEFRRNGADSEVQKRPNHQPEPNTLPSQVNAGGRSIVQIPKKAEPAKVERQKVEPPASTPAKVEPTKPQAVVSATPDPRVVEFKQHITAFLKEARALVRYCHEDTDFKKYAAKRDLLEDVFTHIPDPPHGYEKVYETVGRIKQDFDVERLFRKMDNEKLELLQGTSTYLSEADKVFDRCDTFVKAEKAKLDQLEQALGASH